MYVSNSPNTPDANYKQTKVNDNIQQTNNEQSNNTVFYSNLDDSKNLNVNLQDNSIMATLKNHVSCNTSIPKTNNNDFNNYFNQSYNKLFTYENIKNAVINSFNNLDYTSQSQSSQNETDNYVQGQVKSQISNLNNSLQKSYETAIKNMEQKALQEFEQIQKNDISNQEQENNQINFTVDRLGIFGQNKTDDNDRNINISHGKLTSSINGNNVSFGADKKNINASIQLGNTRLGFNAKHTGSDKNIMFNAKFNI